MYVQQQCTLKTTSFHTIRRQNVLEDLNSLLSVDNVLSEYPLQIKFHGELGFDSGGVCRDMFSAYWEEVYSHYFDGNSVLTPMIHPGINLGVLPMIGCALSHGYLVSGFLPTRIAFPTIGSILLGNSIKVPSDMLIKSFGDSLNPIERSVLKECLSVSSNFPPHLLTQLLAILSRFGCRTQPSPGTLKCVLTDMAKYEFQVKPFAALCSIATGIPSEELPFWQSFSIEELYRLYNTLGASPRKVLDMLSEPVFENERETRIFGYLQDYIAHMKQEEVIRFLRFTTGSSVMISEKLVITFNSLSGFTRRPIAHTCGCTLELSSSYTTYNEFETEFNAILSNDEYAWEMHGL